jgi:hypothetical protein
MQEGDLRMQLQNWRLQSVRRDRVVVGRYGSIHRIESLYRMPPMVRRPSLALQFAQGSATEPPRCETAESTVSSDSLEVARNELSLTLGRVQPNGDQATCLDSRRPHACR